MKNAVKLLCACGALFVCLPTCAQRMPKTPKKPVKIVKPQPGIKKPGPLSPRIKKRIPSNVMEQRVAARVQQEAAKKYITPTTQSHSLDLQHDILASSIASRSVGDYGALQEGLGYSGSFSNTLGNASKQIWHDVNQGVKTYPSQALLMIDLREYVKNATPNTVVDVTVTPEYSTLPVGQYEVFEIPEKRLFYRDGKNGWIQMEGGENAVALDQKHQVILKPANSASQKLHIIERDYLLDAQFHKSLPSSVAGKKFASPSELWTALGGKQAYSLAGDLFADLQLYYANQAQLLEKPAQPIARVEYQIDGHVYDVYEMPIEVMELFGQSKIKAEHTFCLVRADQLSAGNLLPGGVRLESASLLQNNLLYRNAK